MQTVYCHVVVCPANIPNNTLGAKTINFHLWQITHKARSATHRVIQSHIGCYVGPSFCLPQSPSVHLHYFRMLPHSQSMVHVVGLGRVGGGGSFVYGGELYLRKLSHFVVSFYWWRQRTRTRRQRRRTRMEWILCLDFQLKQTIMRCLPACPHQVC